MSPRRWRSNSSLGLIHESGGDLKFNSHSEYLLSTVQCVPGTAIAAGANTSSPAFSRLTLMFGFACWNLQLFVVLMPFLTNSATSRKVFPTSREYPKRPARMFSGAFVSTGGGASEGAGFPA